MKKTIKNKVRGFKVIFGTYKSFEECERIIDEAVGELTNRTGLDFVLHMDDSEIKKAKEDLFEVEEIDLDEGCDDCKRPWDQCKCD